MKNFLINEIKNNLKNIETDDIYAFSLYLEYSCDNPFEPTITFGYNTTENFKNACEETDEQEAKWNFAYWLQNEIFVLGVNETQEMMKNWLIENGFGYKTYDEIYGNDAEEISDELCVQIDEKVKNELIETVQEIQKSNVIQDKFGRQIPIIIHELEYYDEIAEINKKANPAELIQEFVDFCCVVY